MKVLRAIYILAVTILIAAIIWALGADGRSVVEVLGQMLSEPWSIVTLIDLYLGLFISATIIFLFEKNKVTAAFWVLPIFFLGNVWTAVWFIIRLPKISSRLRTHQR